MLMLDHTVYIDGDWSVMLFVFQTVSCEVDGSQSFWR